MGKARKTKVLNYSWLSLPSPSLIWTCFFSADVSLLVSVLSLCCLCLSLFYLCFFQRLVGTIPFCPCLSLFVSVFAISFVCFCSSLSSLSLLACLFLICPCLHGIVWLFVVCVFPCVPVCLFVFCVFPWIGETASNQSWESVIAFWYICGTNLCQRCQVGNLSTRCHWRKLRVR